MILPQLQTLLKGALPHLPLSCSHLLSLCKNCLPDGLTTYGERTCAKGSLGARFDATDIMPYALAHALRLEKFGA